MLYLFFPGMYDIMGIILYYLSRIHISKTYIIIHDQLTINLKVIELLTLIKPIPLILSGTQNPH